MTSADSSLDLSFSSDFHSHPRNDSRKNFKIPRNGHTSGFSNENKKDHEVWPGNGDSKQKSFSDSKEQKSIILSDNDSWLAALHEVDRQEESESDLDSIYKHEILDNSGANLVQKLRNSHSKPKKGKMGLKDDSQEILKKEILQLRNLNTQLRDKLVETEKLQEQLSAEKSEKEKEERDKGKREKSQKSKNPESQPTGSIELAKLHSQLALTELKLKNVQLDYNSRLADLTAENSRLRRLLEDNVLGNQRKESQASSIITRLSEQPSFPIMTPSPIQPSLNYTPQLGKLPSKTTWDECSHLFHTKDIHTFIQERRYPNDKLERLFLNGAKITIFSDGSTREILPDNHTIIHYSNGNTKEIMPNGDIVYWNDINRTRILINASSGMKIYEFSSGQIEKYHSNGFHEISYPDGTTKFKYPNGATETIFPDGTKQHIDVSGQISVMYPNGVKEIMAGKQKQRIYPNGTVKNL